MSIEVGSREIEEGPEPWVGSEGPDSLTLKPSGRLAGCASATRDA